MRLPRLEVSTESCVALPPTLAKKGKCKQDDQWSYSDLSWLKAADKPELRNGTSAFSEKWNKSNLWDSVWVDLSVWPTRFWVWRVRLWNMSRVVRDKDYTVPGRAWQGLDKVSTVRWITVSLDIPLRVDEPRGIDAITVSLQLDVLIL